MESREVEKTRTHPSCSLRSEIASVDLHVQKAATPQIQHLRYCMEPPSEFVVQFAQQLGHEDTAAFLPEATNGQTPRSLAERTVSNATERASRVRGISGFRESRCDLLLRRCITHTPACGLGTRMMKSSA